MTGYWGQWLSRPGGDQAFFGAFSGSSFICHTLGSFLENLGTIPSTTNIRCALLDLFDYPIPEKWRTNPHLHNPPNLPERVMTSRLLDSLFTRCSLIAQLLQEAEVREMMDHIHGWTLQHREAHFDRPLMLAHSIIAVGYLYHTSRHRSQGCRATTGEAYVLFHNLENSSLTPRPLVCSTSSQLVAHLTSLSAMISHHYRLCYVSLYSFF